MNLRIALLLVLASALAGCFTTRTSQDFYRAQRTTLSANRVALPVTFAGNFPFVEVRINGAGPFRMVLDSGSDCLVLAPHVAELAHVPLRSSSPTLVNAASGRKGALEMSSATVKRLEAGGLKLENVGVLVIGKDVFAGEMAPLLKRGNSAFDGILGMAVFYDVMLEIDYPNRCAAVVRLGTESLPRDRSVLFSAVGHDRFASIEVAGKTALAFIDTGSDGGFEIPNLDDVALLYSRQKTDGLAGYGVGGRIPRAEWGQLEGDIRLGPITWQNPPVFCRRRETIYIGSDALCAWKLVFDQRVNRLYLLGEPKTVFKTKQAPDVRFKLGFLCEPYGDGVRLLEVDSGCAFEQAGLRIGDVISTVEGFSAVDWVRRSKRVPPEVYKKPRAKLAVERDGKRFEAILVQGPDASD